jgi:hypothetical protein
MATKIKKSKKDKNYLSKTFELGGTLDQQVGNQNQNVGSAVGSVAGMALTAAGVPGLGPVLSQLGSMIGKKSDEMKVLRDHFNSLNQSTNPYGNYANGGELSGLEGVLNVNAPSHDNGGLNVNAKGIPSPKPVAEIEGDETVATVKGKKIIFSKKLKI